MSSKHNILLDLAVIAGPVALVVAARIAFAPVPDVAIAGPADPAAAIVLPVVAAKKVSPEQQRAAEWIQAMGDMSGVRSPMAHPIPAPVVVIATPQSTEPEASPVPTPPVASPIAGLSLTGVLGNSGGALAVLSGKVYKIGDVVKPGVTLTAIDVRTNTVTFQLANGSEIKLARQLDPLAK